MAACMEACPPVSGPVEVCQTNTASPESPFTAIYFQNDPGSGIGGFALNYTKDAMFPFDFDGDGKDDLFSTEPVEVQLPFSNPTVTARSRLHSSPTRGAASAVMLLIAN